MVDARGVAALTLARAEAANALSGTMLRELLNGARAARESTARVVCLRGTGRNFCAGADIEWMRDCGKLSDAENTREARLFADILHELYSLPQPLLVVARGACYGGGAGLAAVADCCIAADSARFCFSETRLGLIPATIAPYVIRAIGERQARRYFLSAATFDAAQARRLGLAHATVADDDLEQAAEDEIARLLRGGANAQRAVKVLTDDIRGRAIDGELGAVTAAHLARVRAGDEAQEGVAAFLEKRKPAWAQDV